MKKIGFIDYYLDEWHANHYPQWIRDDCSAHGRAFELAYAWAKTDRPEGMSTSQWCAAHRVEQAASVEELVDKSDCLIVLAPDNPELHEELSRLPLMSGKPVYVDKTFSPDLRTGVRMFELAERYRTPLFSSSALRYAKELADYPNETVNRRTLEFVAAFGPGAYDNYAVHQFEMIVSLMGTGAKRIKSLSSLHGRLLVADYADGRQASFCQTAAQPFQLSLQLNNGEGVHIAQCTDIFPRLIHAILDFFESGRPPVPAAETLEIMALIEAGRKALAQRDVWVALDGAV
jgi:hypothetical protein